MRTLLLAAVAVLSAATPAAARWRVATSPHFTIYSEQSAADLKRYAEQMERYDATLRLLTGGNAQSTGPATRVTVYQVRNMAAMRQLTGSNMIAGMYQPRASGSTAFTPAAGMAGAGGPDLMNARSILLHEYAHHFMHLNLPAAYPSWFVEGFAEFAGQTSFDKDGSIVIGGAPMYRSWGIARGAVSVTDVLTQGTPRNKVDLDEFYGRAWQLTHYLTFANDRKGQLDAYLRAVAGGTPRAKAATDAFGDLGKLTRDAYAYINQRTIPGVKLGASAVPVPTVAVAELSDGADAILPLKLVSQRGVTDAQAKALLPQAQAIAARHIGDAFVLRELVEASFDAGDHAGTIAYADRLLAATPGDVDAMTYRGRALAAQAKADSKTDKATWAEVRRWYLAANKADRSHPDPLYFFYGSFDAAGEPPTRNAVMGLIEASRLAPQAADVRMALVHQLLVDGDIAAARSALTPLGNDERGRGQILAPVWAAIDANDAKAALAALDAGSKPAANKTAERKH